MEDLFTLRITTKKLNNQNNVPDLYETKTLN